jgi:hypothetical protein
LNEIPKASVPALISATLSTLMVLVGILLNRSDINRLDAQMTKLNDKMDAMDAMDAWLNDRMDAMRDSFHSDIVMLVQRDGDKDSRISRLGERRGNA